MTAHKKEILSKNKTQVFSRSRLLFYIFTAIIFAAAVYYFSTIKKDVLLLKKVNYFWLAAAVTGQGFTYLASALVYRQLLGSFKNLHLPGILDWMKASIVALFLNQAVPSAGLSGNAFIFNFLGKRNIPANHIISLILVELLSFYVAMELIIILLLLASFIFMKIPAFFPSILFAGILVFLAFFLGIGFIGRKRSLGWLYKKISKISWIRNLMNRADTFSRTQSGEDAPYLLDLVKQRTRSVVIAILFQVFVVLADSFTIFALFTGLGSTISFPFIMLGLVCTKIISILPFLPGALILYESSMTYAFVSLGQPVAVAVIVTILYRVLSFWLPIPVGLFLYGKLTRNKLSN